MEVDVELNLDIDSQAISEFFLRNTFLKLKVMNEELYLPRDDKSSQILIADTISPISKSVNDIIENQAEILTLKSLESALSREAELQAAYDDVRRQNNYLRGQLDHVAENL